MKAGPIYVEEMSVTERFHGGLDTIRLVKDGEDYAACSVKSVKEAHELDNFDLKLWCEDVFRANKIEWTIRKDRLFVMWDDFDGECAWVFAFDTPDGLSVMSSDWNVLDCPRHCLGGLWVGLSRTDIHVDIDADKVGLDIW